METGFIELFCDNNMYCLAVWKTYAVPSCLENRLWRVGGRAMVGLGAEQ